MFEGMKTEIFRLENVTKTVNHIPRLDDLNLTIRKGEILGLLSLNDEGKTCLTNILCGQSSIDYGRIYYNDELVDLDSEAPLPFAGRVVSVENKTKLTFSLSVADNIFVVRKGFRKYLINRRVLREQAGRIFAEFGIDIDPGASAMTLSPLECGLVELVKGYATGARLIILNNLSSYLSTLDLNRFHQLVFQLKEKGISFLYIDNDPDVIFKVCDRLFIMREGRNVRTFKKGECDEQTALTILTGRVDERESSHKSHWEEAKVLVFNTVSARYLQNISFVLRRGEVVSILDTHGRSNNSILELLTGEQAREKGQILLDGEDFNVTGHSRAIRRGIGLISEDSLENTLIYDLSPLDNLCIPLFEKLKTLIYKKGIRKSVRMEYADKLGEDIHQKDLYHVQHQTLQKLVYYRWLLYSPKVLVCVKPLSGLDISGRKLTLDLIGQLSAKGIAILILTSNFSEAYYLSDRVILIDGAIKQGEYLRDDPLLKQKMGYLYPDMQSPTNPI